MHDDCDTKYMARIKWVHVGNCQSTVCNVHVSLQRHSDKAVTATIMAAVLMSSLHNKISHFIN